MDDDMFVRRTSNEYVYYELVFKTRIMVKCIRTYLLYTTRTVNMPCVHIQSWCEKNKCVNWVLRLGDESANENIKVRII